MASTDGVTISTTVVLLPSAGENRATEIKRLKDKYGNDFRVIENIGDFACVAQLTLKEFDVAVKFQVPGGYPTVPLGVIITSHSNSETFVTELQQFLLDSNKTGLMTDYIEMAILWLTEHYRISESESVKPKIKTKQLQKKKTALETDEVSAQKEPMKTAEDVIKRIQWDSNLEPDAFSVGYLDRFTGLTEKNFSNFSWEDLASVDYTVLAIPKHRIQYFKYKDVIVWDKRYRLDNIFGSAGSKVSITDVIANYVEKKATSDDSTRNSHAINQTIDNAEKLRDDIRNCPGNYTNDENDGEEDDDDDSDDGICVTLESKQNVEDEFSDEEAAANEPWQNKLRPNYFLCQRINCPEIVSSVDAMQNQILDLDSRYLDCCIKPYMLHVTLCTLGLYVPEHIAEVAEILNTNKDDLAEMVQSGVSIKISGVGNFFQRVVYGRVHHDEKFLNYVQHIRTLICESGINISDNYDFVPHMTILKVTRPVARCIGTKKVPSWMYEDFSDMEFGSQVIDGIYLCAMKGEKLPGKFYDSPAHISF